MIRLQYLSKGRWIDVSEWCNELTAWLSLGSDNFNYRTIDEDGNILTDKSDKELK